jgi:hypothetical protein
VPNVIVMAPFGNLDPDPGGLDPAGRLSEIPNILLEDEPGLQIVDRSRSVEGREGEARLGEPPLLEQGAEHIDRVVAAAVTRLQIDAREQASAHGAALRRRPCARRHIELQLRVVFDGACRRFAERQLPSSDGTFDCQQESHDWNNAFHRTAPNCCSSSEASPPAARS